MRSGGRWWPLWRGAGVVRGGASACGKPGAAAPADRDAPRNHLVDLPAVKAHQAKRRALPRQRLWQEHARGVWQLRATTRAHRHLPPVTALIALASHETAKAPTTALLVACANEMPSSIYGRSTSTRCARWRGCSESSLRRPRRSQRHAAAASSAAAKRLRGARCRYQRLKPRIGHGRALGAVKHSMLNVYWHMFSTGETSATSAATTFNAATPHAPPSAWSASSKRSGTSSRCNPTQPERSQAFPSRPLNRQTRCRRAVARAQVRVQARGQRSATRPVFGSR
jgi:hypothetical protein